MDRKRRDARHSRRNFLKTAAGVSAGAMLMRDPLWAQSAPGGKAAASALAEDPPALHDHAEAGAGLARLQGRVRSHLRRQHGVEALHRLPDLEDAGVRRRRSRLRRHPVRPLHRRGLAGSADAHARLAERGGETRHRRNAGAGRRLVRHDVGLDAARRHHGADAVLRSGASAGGRRRSPARSWSSRHRSSRRRRTTTTSSTTTRSPTTSGARPASGRSCSRRRRSPRRRRFTAGGCGVS